VIVKGGSAVINLFLPDDGLFVEIDSATAYGDHDMAVEVAALCTLEKHLECGANWI
jgi:hypothetical protein